MFWDNYYKKEDGFYYFAWNTLATKDGGCIIAATRNNIDTQGNKVDLYLLKVDSLGNYTPTNIKKEIKQEQNVFVYPNPGNYEINLHTPENMNGAEFCLYSVSGKKVLNQYIENGRATINTCHLQKGIYIYELRKNGEVLSRGKWVKQ